MPDRPIFAALQQLLICVVTSVLLGCTATAPINPAISQAQPKQGYRIPELIKRERGPDNHPNAMVLLAFSGGGTRAAALAYGVLEELRRTNVTVRGHTHRMLDEVDLIAGVSGGSFTALGYALYGDRLFTEFEPKFLKRDVQGELLKRALNPMNWAKLNSPYYGRSELAADFYDEILFHGATYGDLLTLPTPAAIVTGTDISTGARFEFSQDAFDLLCSDLGSMRLARAAATSSAVPVVLSPVTFYNYGGRCHAQMPAWVTDIAQAKDPHRPAGRALLRYRDIQSFQDSANRPFLHVIDGGVSDNLGLRGMLEAFEEIEASKEFQREINFQRMKHIVVIVVNSRSAPSTDWDRSRTPPGMFGQVMQASSVPIDHFSYESVELLKDIAQRWTDKRNLAIAQLRIKGASQAEAEAAVPMISFNTIDVSFDAIADPIEQRYFMELPTSFSLPVEAVDKLRELGGRLLRESPRFIELMENIAREENKVR